jgi:Cu2+-exporting ATPase
MVGDGVNDAAAMARAHVGVGVHGGAEACLQAADVFLGRPGLASLVALTRGARRTLRVIHRNIAISIVYNLAGVGLAMTGVLDPLIAAIMMPASSATVILGSWRSRTFDPEAA